MEEQDSLQVQRQSPPRQIQSQESTLNPIEGMESVVATVSGYHGLERFTLIKLISSAGANYVGAMSRSTTHLVCWKFEGRKYDLAKKFRTLIVNHRWFEECIKQGKRVPERPYILQSGQEVGPLSLELPLVNVGIYNNKGKRLSDHSNDRDHTGKEINDMGLGASSDTVWTDSCLLKENLFPDVGKSSDMYLKSKRKSARRASKQEPLSSSRLHFQEPLSGLLRIEEESSSYFSMHSAREKKKVSNGDKSTPLAESSRRARKLVKKNVCSDRLESLLSDSDQECNIVGAHTPHDSYSTLSGHSDGPNILEIRERSDGCCSHRESKDEDVEGITAWNHIPPTGSNLCTRDVPRTLERPVQDGVSDVENLKGDTKDGGQLEHVNISPTSTELSCVICWTDFSSTRGVLPCGHRFCYSCIQNWADHMVARGRVSTCPLCKANFASIKKVEDAVTSDQKIYSQTIPYSSSAMDIFILNDRETLGLGAQSSRASVCSKCHFREPEDCLISCHLCQTRCIHSYCLDPPLLPWTCTHCKDLQMLYLRSR